MADALRGRFRITTDVEAFDVDAIHAYLTRSFWAAGIPRALVEKSLRDSLSWGLFDRERQIGFARMVTDRATYAYLCDVYVLEEYRGQGLGKWLMDEVMAHSDTQGLRRIMLVTRDAHGLYERHGFTPPHNPERHMEIFRPGLYRQDAAAGAAGAFRLASESGRESIRWEVRERRETRLGPALRCDVSLTGAYFGEGLADAPGDDAPVRPVSGAPDYLLVFRNFMVGLAEMTLLHAYLDEWLRLSASEQASHPLGIDCTLGSLFDQNLVLAIGSRTDVLSGGLPVATLRFVAGRTEGEMSFVAGPAALRELSRGLAACLA
jgi:N-acetylglutamate synthase-like GNAT family acetyltransferase